MIWSGNNWATRMRSMGERPLPPTQSLAMPIYDHHTGIFDIFFLKPRPPPMQPTTKAGHITHWGHKSIIQQYSEPGEAQNTDCGQEVEFVPSTSWPFACQAAVWEPLDSLEASEAAPKPFTPKPFFPANHLTRPVCIYNACGIAIHLKELCSSSSDTNPLWFSQSEGTWFA